MARSSMEVLPPVSMPCYPSSRSFLGEWWSGGGMGTGRWTPEENKRFEYALATFDKDTPDRWLKVAASIPGKTPSDVESHYRDLLDDVSEIEAGRIRCPGYDPPFTVAWESNYGLEALKHPCCVAGKRSGPRAPDQERKKGVPWTEDEHKRFLLGLQKHGKGDWRNISRNFVITRNPTQVASHAQKYFIRLNSGGKDKRRSSIHDITTANLPENKPLLPSQSSSSASAAPPSVSFSSILDSSRPNEATAMPSSLAQGSQFVEPRHGVTAYGLKLEAHDAMFRDRNLLFQMPSSHHPPHG
ncbi:unnamed protein product [Musa textilis]